MSTIIHLLQSMMPAFKGKRKMLAGGAAGKGVRQQLPSGDDHDDFGDIDTGPEGTASEHFIEEGTLIQETGAPAIPPARKPKKKRKIQKQLDVQVANEQGAGAVQVHGNGGGKVLRCAELCD